MIVIDVETSGIDPEANSILSIGAVDFSSPGRQFYGECRLRDGSAHDPASLLVNGFNADEISGTAKMPLDALLRNFLKWAEETKDMTLAGHNVQFDIKFLEQSFRLYGMKWIFGHRSVDTHSIVYCSCLSRSLEIPTKNNRTDINSDTVFGYVGLPGEPKPHNALTGAKMEAEALSRLICGRFLLEEFERFPVPDFLARKDGYR